MDTSKNIKPFNDFFLEKAWTSYTLTDTRRMKSFYYLFYTLAVFFIFWVTKEQSLELPILKTKVDTFIAFSLFPALIFILAGRYFFLCAHTIETSAIALKSFVRIYSVDLSKLDYTIGDIYLIFKQRDLTENLNIYFFPISWAMTDKSSSKGKRLVFSGVYSIVNVLILLTIVLPILSYWIVYIWIKDNFQVYMSVTLGYTILVSYFILGVLFVMVPVYFFYRIEDSRNYHLFLKNTERKWRYQKD